ncbi:hypothetical protein [Rhodococcus opacus]|uniref:hypothetical protein n=1 Tax=Rhodococcus opacus TaxID=37919 RepID=UPI002955118F|nr:hypothetical protein [Rhodococcus opacus]
MTTLAITLLLDRTHSELAPAYFFAVAVIVTIAATILYNESRDREVATAAVR